MTPEEKEKIDYEIKARREDRNREVFEWGCAIYLVLFVGLLIYIISILM